MSEKDDEEESQRIRKVRVQREIFDEDGGDDDVRVALGVGRSGAIR